MFLVPLSDLSLMISAAAYTRAFALNHGHDIAQDAPMPVFLFISAIFNAIFLVRVVRDLRQGSILSGSPAVAMLLSACAELVWVLPCFIQCMLIFFMGNDGIGDFSPNEAFGCDFQGFYSVVGSIAGMLSGMLIAVYTHKIANGFSMLGQDGLDSKLPSKKFTTIVAVSIFVLALLVAMLPIVAFGHYKNNNEGFCYIDWFDGAQSGIMFAITLPTFVITVAIYVRVLARGRWPNTLDIVLLLLSFISAWVLWLPASIMGFAQTPFPTGYHISGGVLGHAQALVNPYLYGIRWRDTLIGLGGGMVPSKTAMADSSQDTSGTADAVPSVSPTPASLPPSPPSSTSGLDGLSPKEPAPARKLAWEQ